jgi:hypothetical protein
MPIEYRCFKNKKTGQACHIPAGRYGNFLNAIKKIVSFVKYNMPRYYVALLTLTVAENLQEVGYEHLHRVMTLIKTRLNRAGSILVYIAVKEYQERGAVHYHVLCIYDMPYVFPSSEVIERSWGLGFVKISAPKIRLRLWKIVSYIGKYIGKGYEYETLNFKKSFTASQIKQIYKLSPKRLSEVIKRFGKEKAETFKCTYRKIYAYIYERKREPVFDEYGFLDKFREVNRLVKKELVMEFPSEWGYMGIYYDPF